MADLAHGDCFHIICKYISRLKPQNLNPMTQIVVTLEEGSNLSIIRSAINLIKGVKDTMVTHVDSKHTKSRTEKRLQAFDKVPLSIRKSFITMCDEKEIFCHCLT